MEFHIRRKEGGKEEERGRKVEQKNEDKVEGVILSPACLPAFLILIFLYFFLFETIPV